MIDLAAVSLDERKKILTDFAAKGVHVARVGDYVFGSGGSGTIISGTDIPCEEGGPGIAVMGSRYEIPFSTHGCPECPHHCLGIIIDGHPVLHINGTPVVIFGSRGVHPECGPGRAIVGEGFGKARQRLSTGGTAKLEGSFFSWPEDSRRP